MITGGRAARGGASRSGRGSRRSGRLFGQRRAEASLFAHREPDCPPGRWLSRARWFEPCFDINNCRSCHLSWKLMVQQAGNFVLLSANDSGVIALLYEGRKRRKREKRKRKKNPFALPALLFACDSILEEVSNSHALGRVRNA